MNDPSTLARIFGISLAIAFSGALMPGPMLVVTAVHTHRRGWTAGPLVVLGHAWLELVLVSAAILGLGPLLAHPTVMGVTGLAGGVVLGVMGFSMLRSAPKVELSDPAVAGGDQAGGPRFLGGEPLHRGAFIAGVWSSLINPYWSIWWLCIGLGLIAMSVTAGMAGLVVFFVGHILADLIWYTVVSVSIAKGRRLVSRRVFRGMIVAGGLLLAVLAARFGYFGVKTLWQGGYEKPEMETPAESPPPGNR